MSDNQKAVLRVTYSRELTMLYGPFSSLTDLIRQLKRRGWLVTVEEDHRFSIVLERWRIGGKELTGEVILISGLEELPSKYAVD